MSFNLQLINATCRVVSWLIRIFLTWGQTTKYINSTSYLLPTPMFSFPFTECQVPVSVQPAPLELLWHQHQ